MNIHPTIEIDTQIATIWPKRWAKANAPYRTNKSRSKARTAIRKQYRDYLKLVEFENNNPSAKCGNCAHKEKIRFGKSNKMHCGLGSDFHGYVLTTTEYVCIRWQAAL